MFTDRNFQSYTTLLARATPVSACKRYILLTMVLSLCKMRIVPLAQGSWVPRPRSYIKVSIVRLVKFKVPQVVILACFTQNP